VERTLTVMPDPLLVVIIGPTGSGKTALSVALAQKFGGEIVNCDSVAMVREFEIGTAKASDAERQLVPHHLLDIVDPRGFITAGEYARQARERLTDITNRGRLPIIAGGTGLYLRALIEGLFPGPQRSEKLRTRLLETAEEQGNKYLHGILRRLDPAAAEKIHAHDVPKVVRAIEVCMASRHPMTELWKQGQDPLTGFRILRIGLDPERQELYERINLRALKMFEQGLVKETSDLRQKYGDDIQSLYSLGYKQAMQLLRNEISRETAIKAAQQAHRNYAKRQMTWFRREPDVSWLKGFGDDAAISAEAKGLVVALQEA
jgi:tRNA dimethylallyltransferase